MNRALILVDLQMDFTIGGTMAVPDATGIIPAANQAIGKFDLIVSAIDWHPANHRFFATSHPNKKPGDVIELHGQPTMLQPKHCVLNTRGSEPMPGIVMRNVQRVIRKGMDPDVDGRSAFFDDSPSRPTVLDEFLRERGVGAVYVLGLGTEHSVRFTALDARRLGFETYLIEDACRAWNRQIHDLAKAIEQMRAAGVSVLRSSML
jgi:nicotinamidase/pyrazinamidase